MAWYLEDGIPGVKYNGLNTEKDATFAGSTTFSGTVAFTSTLAGVKRPVTTGTDANYTLTTAQSGGIFVATKSSATQTYTLPAVATAGVTYTFICGHADGEILVTPQSGEAIKIVTFAAVGADADTGIVAPAAGTGVKNTAGTNAVTDNLTLVSDGTQWLGVGITGGIWASQ